MGVNFNDIIEGLKIIQKKHRHLLIEYNIDDISFKIFITNSSNLIIDNAFYGAEINIFNNTLDFSLIDINGDIFNHQFCDTLTKELVFEFVEKAVNKLSSNQSPPLPHE